MSLNINDFTISYVHVQTKDLGVVSFKNPRKQAIIDKCFTDIPVNIEAVRLIELDVAIDCKLGDMNVTVGSQYFDYLSESNTTHWYPNYADPDLFGYWDSNLLAQDELQTLEMPHLTLLRKYLLSNNIPTGTTFFDQSTPWLITGVPRYLSLDVTHLYGNVFNQTPIADCVSAATKIEHPVPQNIYAITAPACGLGFYTESQIRSIFCACYTAFYGLKSFSEFNPIVHLGFWGCGAFGGNKVLMTALQLFVANFAGIRDITFHHSGDVKAYHDGYNVYLQMLKSGVETPDDVVYGLMAQSFKWGVSDGN